MTGAAGEWEGLDPWEKAAQWREVAPEITDQLVALAKAHAVQNRRIQAAREKELADAARFDREQREIAASRSYELSKKRLEIQESLALRLWWTQLIAVTGGIISVAGIIACSLLLGVSGSVGSGVTIFALGSALIAGVYRTNVSNSKRLKSLLGGGGASDSLGGSSEGVNTGEVVQK